MKPEIKIEENYILINGHYDDPILCAKLTLLCQLYGAKEFFNGYAKLDYNEDFLNKLKFIDNSLIFGGDTKYGSVYIDGTAFINLQTLSTASKITGFHLTFNPNSIYIEAYYTNSSSVTTVLFSNTYYPSDFIIQSASVKYGNGTAAFNPDGLVKDVTPTLSRTVTNGIEYYINITLTRGPIGFDMFIGNSRITKAYIGNTNISKIFIGGSQLW